MTVQPIPEGYHTITPYMLVDDLAAFIDFMKRAFDAEETEKITLPDGSIMHAEVRIGDSPLMMGGARPEFPAMPGFLYLYVPDVDTAYQKALDAGATAVQPPEDQFYGDRSGGVKDPFGNLWWLGTHVEDVPHDEIMKRAAAMAEERGG